MAPETFRSFIAVQFPDAVQAGCGTMQREFRRDLPRISWVKEGNIHLTLKFLGDITHAQEADVIEALEAPLQEHAPFQVTLGGIGVFPNWRRPRVLWVGLEDPKNGLATLAQTVERGLQGQGFKREDRPFHSHLTLARIRRPTDLSSVERKTARYETLDLPPVRVDHVILMQSVLHPQGSIYTPLHEFRLKTE